MSNDLFVMADFVSAADRNAIEAYIGRQRKFFRVGPMVEELSEHLGHDVPRSAVEAAARRLGYKINFFRFAEMEGGSDGSPEHF